MSEWICNQIFYSTLSNSKMIRTVKNLILIQDFISSLKFHGNISTHNVGRRGETTSLEERDLDKIFIWEKIMLFQPTVHESFLWEEVMVFEDTDLAIDQNCVVFVLDRMDCQQGYTKLKLIMNDVLKEIIQGRKTFLMDLTKETPNGIYLSNRKFNEFPLQVLDSSNAFSKVVRHGPCVTTISKGECGYQRKTLSGKEFDFAQGFRICNLTKEGEHWLHIMDATTKENFWPSVKTVKKISKLKCNVVAVGRHDPDFSDSSLKWRISYTLWERELIWSFCDVQLHCYVFLKLFLKKKLKYISKDITSLHMKNVVFWESVNCSLEMLQNKANFFAFLNKCLIRLLWAIDEQNLLHFIDRNKNLFESKLTDEKAKRKLLNHLDEILIGSQNLVPVVFECIGRDDMKELWDRCGLDPAAFLRRSHMSDENVSVEDNQELIEFTLKLPVVSGIQAQVFLDISDENLEHVLKNLDALNEIGVEKKYVGITENIVRFHYKLMSPESYLCNDESLSDFISYRKTLFTDALSDRLYLSTCLIKYSRYSEAEVIIDEFLNTDPKLYIYHGTCSDCVGIAVEKGQVAYVKTFGAEKCPFVFDIFISKSNDGCFPPAIEIQSSLEFSFDLNPVVYMFYLKVLCDTRANRNTDYSLQRLHDSVNQCGLEQNNFRNFNLLGHACMLTKRYRDAYCCFMKSILDSVSRNAPNSVYYLLLVLVHQLFY